MERFINNLFQMPLRLCLFLVLKDFVLTKEKELNFKLRHSLSVLEFLKVTFENMNFSGELF